MVKDIRYIQRFKNFEKAFARLKEAVGLANSRNLSDLEKQGLIQAFEYTHELAWNVLKDFLQEQGNKEIYGSKDATREAFNVGLISEGEVWMEMIKSRNQTTHTYNQEITDEIVSKILGSYFAQFTKFENKFLQLIKA